jgi:hypothetical protein
MTFLPITISLIEFIDSKPPKSSTLYILRILDYSLCGLGEFLEKLIIVLRDGKKIIGILRSYDQFGKLEMKIPSM